MLRDTVHKVSPRRTRIRPVIRDRNGQWIVYLTINPRYTQCLDVQLELQERASALIQELGGQGLGCRIEPSASTREDRSVRLHVFVPGAIAAVADPLELSA